MVGKKVWFVEELKFPAWWSSGGQWTTGGSGGVMDDWVGVDWSGLDWINF